MTNPAAQNSNAVTSVIAATVAMRENGASAGETPEIKKGSLCRNESPMSQALTSITPWMPNVIKNERTGSFVKFLIPSQVVQPEARESAKAVAPTRIKRQFNSFGPCALVDEFCAFVRHRRPTAIPASNVSKGSKIDPRSCKDIEALALSSGRSV